MSTRKKTRNTAPRRPRTEREKAYLADLEETNQRWLDKREKPGGQAPARWFGLWIGRPLPGSEVA